MLTLSAQILHSHCENSVAYNLEYPGEGAQRHYTAKLFHGIKRLHRPGPLPKPTYLGSATTHLGG